MTKSQKVIEETADQHDNKYSKHEKLKPKLEKLKKAKNKTKETPPGLEKKKEKIDSGQLNEMNKGSEQDQASRENRRKWWQVWE